MNHTATKEPLSVNGIVGLQGQNYKNPLTYNRYADGIYSLLTKKKMSSQINDCSLMYIYVRTLSCVNRYIVPFFITGVSTFLQSAAVHL